MNLLSEDIKITEAISPTNGAAGTTDIEGATLDMQGYDGVLVYVATGTITSGAVTGFVLQSDDNDGFTSATAKSGGSITVADTDDDTFFILDWLNPPERYVRLHVDRATQNAVIEHATYIQYGARSKPTTTGADDIVKVVG